jgi:hypothetical protein
MDKRMDLSEKMSMENNAANQESNGEMFVHRVARSGFVLKFKQVDKYGTLPSKHTISSQEVMMSGGKQNVRELLDNFEANCSPNAIPLLLHTCNECGKCFKEISSLHGHKGVHRREEKKRMCMMMADQQPIAVEASHVVSSPKPREKKKNETKTIWFAAQALEMLSMEFKQHRPDFLSASMTYSNKHISANEETDEMREVAEILVTLAQSFCKDITVHVSSSASIAKCFVCTTCKKMFSSYHALGGHMSIHNNKPTKNSLLEDGGAGSSGGGRERCTWKHVCDMCNKKFPNGQVLGGHKRRHWWEEHYYKMALLEDRNVKSERSGLVVVPTDEKIQPAGTELVVAAHTVPLACDDVQQPQQAMSLGNETELPVPSGVSDENVA